MSDTEGTAYVWLRTHGGAQFIPLGPRGEIVLWPSRAGVEKWDVIYAPPRGEWSRLHSCLDTASAVAQAETEAEARSGGLNVTRSASWRKKQVSDQQRDLAASMGLALPDGKGVRAGDVSDLITTAVASRKLDRFLPKSG